MSIGPRPDWLEEEAEISALLHAVLDRFDQQPCAARHRPVLLSAERFVPSLARGATAADPSWVLVCELQRLGVLRVRAARSHPLDPPWQGARLAFEPDCEAVLRQWLGREPVEPLMAAWRRAIERHAAAFAQGGAALTARRIEIPGRSAEQIVQAFAAIGALRGPLTLRQLSATAFWGNSKVLDGRAELLAALFPQLQIRARPIVAAVHLPASGRGTLFVENQDTYTAAAAGFPPAAAPLALVYAAGFRAAAERIRKRTGALLHFAGPGAPARQAAFERWWFEDAEPLGPCWFWGDLDFAGMQILKSLRNRFPGLTAWRPGYEPMLQRLSRQGGYRPSSAGEPAQSDPLDTGCPFADSQLLPAIREHGQLDQESVCAPAR